MKNLLILSEAIITQAREMLGELLDKLTSLSSDNREFEASYQLKNELYQLGWNICAVNYCNPSDIADEFHFDVLKGDCFIGPEDSFVTVGLNLLCALAEEEDKDISWYTFAGDYGVDERDCYLGWEYGSFYMEKAKELDSLLS